MKKKHFFFLLFSCVFSQAQVQTQNFDGTSLPTGWTATAVSGTKNWTFGSGDMPNGAISDFTTNAAIFVDINATNNIAELISPTIDVSNYTSLSLSFDYIMQIYQNFGNMKVEVWNGTTWIQLLYKDIDVNLTNVSFDVLAYKNASFKVRFTYNDEGGWGWGLGIDNFNLSGTLSNESFVVQNNKVFPNPVKDFLTIDVQEPIEKVSILDVSGKIIAQPNTISNTVDVSNLQSGIYLVNYTANHKNYVSKIVKQ